MSAPLAAVVHALVLVAVGILTIMFSSQVIQRDGIASGEYYTLILFAIAAIFVVRAIKVVPQQNAWVVERLGKYHSALAPGLNILIPFVDKVAYRHSLKEIPLDVPSPPRRAGT